MTLSTCVLSQLSLPFRRAWAPPRSDWARFTSAVTSVHLATLAGITTRAGILVCDVQSTERVPELDRFRNRSSGDLAAFVDALMESDDLAPSPDPRAIWASLEAPGMASLVSGARVVEPWLWDLGDVRRLVCGLTFRHPRQ
jgi:hypothetical protein